MSEFIKKYKKWHAENNMKYDSATQYHKALQGRFGNWRSPSDFRKLQYELNNAEMMLGLKKVAVKNLLSEKRQLREEVEKLKVDKQLVVVPKCVDDYIKECVGYTIYGSLQKLAQKMSRTDTYKWVFASGERQEIFSRAFLDGYTVEKEKLFYLKNKITGNRLYKQPKEAGSNLVEVIDCLHKSSMMFTQQEIDGMETGSYERIEVDE